jgi:phosphoglycerate kinase
VANPKKPFAAIVGGSKVSSKIGVIESLLEKVDLLFLGGGMIYTFYKAQGHSVGSSLVEEDKLDLATSLIEKAKVKGVKLLLPADVLVADKFAPDANSKVLCHCPFKLCALPLEQFGQILFWVTKEHAWMHTSTRNWNVI